MNDDILTKFMLGETSNEEEIEVNKWIQEDRKNEKYFKDFKLIWDTSLKFASASTVDENDAWDVFKQKRDELKKPEAEVISIRPDFNWLKIAAAIALLIIAAGVFYNLIEKKTDLPVAIIKIRTSNEVIIKTLSDGSVVTLNKNSILSYPEKFAGNKREINLEAGEAFFNVTPDKSKPFVVNTKDLSINVVGTSFNVKDDQNKTEVIVETGIVNVVKKETAIRLEAKEKVLIRKTDESFTKEKNTDQFHNYYRTNLLVADNTPLWRVVEVLNEAYDAHIIIEGNNLRDLSLSTTFKLEYSLDKILDIISETLNIKVIRSKDQIILK